MSTPNPEAPESHDAMKWEKREFPSRESAETGIWTVNSLAETVLSHNLLINSNSEVLAVVAGVCVSGCKSDVRYTYNGRHFLSEGPAMAAAEHDVKYKIIDAAHGYIAKVKDLEHKHQMQIAAISTISFCNTRESLDRWNLPKDNEYWTGAFGDVVTGVEREIKLLERVAQLENLAKPISQTGQAGFSFGVGSRVVVINLPNELDGQKNKWNGAKGKVDAPVVDGGNITVRLDSGELVNVSKNCYAWVIGE